MSRRIRATAVLLAALLAAPVAMARDAVAYPPETVLLFVAGWCAPCRAEVARLDAITAAAQPYAVRVVLADDTRVGREMLRGVAPERRWQPDGAAWRRAQSDLLVASAGLPYSLAIDAVGERCGERRDGLDAARVRLLVQACIRRR